MTELRKDAEERSLRQDRLKNKILNSLIVFSSLTLLMTALTSGAVIFGIVPEKSMPAAIAIADGWFLRLTFLFTVLLSLLVAKSIEKPLFPLIRKVLPLQGSADDLIDETTKYFEEEQKKPKTKNERKKK